MINLTYKLILFLMLACYTMGFSQKKGNLKGKKSDVLNKFNYKDEEGADIYNPASFNLNSKIPQKFILKGKNLFYLNYYLYVPKKLILEISKINLRNDDIIVKLFKRGTKEDISLDSFVLKDSTTRIEINAIDGLTKLSIQNIVGNPQKKYIVSIKVLNVITNTFSALDQTNEKIYKFKLNKITGSTFFKLKLDSTTLYNINVLSNLNNVRFDIGCLTKEMKTIPSALVYEKDKNEIYQFILKRGEYIFVVRKISYSWPNDVLPDSIFNEEFKLNISKIKKEQKTPNSIKLLEDWLEDTKLSNYIKVISYSCDSNSTEKFMTPQIEELFIQKKNMITVKNSLGNLNNKFEKQKIVDDLENEFMNSADFSQYTKTNWYQKDKEPYYFLYLSPLVDKTEMSKIESMFHKEFGITIWHKIYDKIRLFNNTPFDKIIIYVPVWCSGDWVYPELFNSKYYINRIGPECASGGYATMIPNFSSIKTKSSLGVPKIVNLKKSAEPFLKSIIFKNSSCSIEFLESDEYSFSVIIRNVKGYILKGDDKWEKIEIKCFIRKGENGQFLQAETDGVYTSGLGNYPKDSQFDKGFEPQLKANLISFSQHFVTEFKNFFSNSMENKFKYSVGLFIILSHLIVILSLIILRVIGGYDQQEFTTLTGIIAPMFAGFTTSVIMFIINDRFTSQIQSNVSLSGTFMFLSYLFPTLFNLSILIPIWLQAYNYAFENFEDFKSYILVIESLFATYSGYFVYTLFEKQKRLMDNFNDYIFNFNVNNYIFL